MRASFILCAFTALLLGGVLGSGCGNSGLGGAVRNDIKKQMDSAQNVITACYEAALQRNRKLKGTVVVRVKTDPETGRFHKASVKSSEVKDKELEQCVIGAVAQLKLDKPTTTSVEADYPIAFAYKK